MKIKKYAKKSDITYAIGVSPTLELLENKPKQVLFVALKSNSEKNVGTQKIKKICEEKGISFSISDKTIKTVTKKENVFAVGVLKKYEMKMEPDENAVVLINPSGRGNVGTIMRTMAAFNVRNLAIIKPGVAIFHPEVIRASIGKIFEINVEYFDSFEEFQRVAKGKVYTFMTNGDKNMAEVSFDEKYVLIFGSEGAGLSDKFKKIGTSVKIEQSKNVDSLNLATSVGIALYRANITGRNPQA